MKYLFFVLYLLSFNTYADTPVLHNLKLQFNGKNSALLPLYLEHYTQKECSKLYPDSYDKEDGIVFSSVDCESVNPTMQHLYEDGNFYYHFGCSIKFSCGCSIFNTALKTCKVVFYD